jgi:hypothetical protein
MRLAVGMADDGTHSLLPYSRFGFIELAHWNLNLPFGLSLPKPFDKSVLS